MKWILNKQSTHRSPKSSEEPVIMVSLGSRGGITQVKVELLGGEKRQLIRNVKGSVRVGDVLSLLECEREARRLR